MIKKQDKDILDTYSLDELINYISDTYLQKRAESPPL